MLQNYNLYYESKQVSSAHNKYMNIGITKTVLPNNKFITLFLIILPVKYSIKYTFN